MVDHDLAIEALSALCNIRITPSHQLSSEVHGNAEKLHIRRLVQMVLDGESSCLGAGHLEHSGGQSSQRLHKTDGSTGKLYIIDLKDFFDPDYHYDFTNVTDSQTYSRGGETYERPCGWYRFAIKVLDKYDENTWLGKTNRSTQSVPGEWPVSYHGTSQKGAEGVIEGHFKPGPGAVYGHGVYSTPDLSVASAYAKSFRYQKTGKTYKVILQNRINPEHREKYNQDKYWLVPVPRDASDEKVEELVKRAIRPYGLLLKEV